MKTSVEALGVAPLHVQMPRFRDDLAAPEELLFEKIACQTFGRLAAIIISSEDKEDAEATARRIARAAPEVEGMAVFGPAPAPLAMLRGRHRQRLLIHAARKLDVQDVIRDWLGGVDWGSKVRVAVDVDPYSFL